MVGSMLSYLGSSKARLLRRLLLVAGLVAALAVPANALAQGPNHESLTTRDVNVSAAQRAKKKKGVSGSWALGLGQK